MDIAGLAGKPEKGWKKHTYDEGGAYLGMHDSNLFDEDGDQAGGLYDEADGHFIDNSSYDGTEHLSEVKAKGGSEDVMGPVKQKFDTAAAWLAEHDVLIVPLDETERQDTTKVA